VLIIHGTFGAPDKSKPDLQFDLIDRERLSKINLLSLQKLPIKDGQLILIRDRGTVLGVAEATGQAPNWELTLHLLGHRLQPPRPKPSEARLRDTRLGIIQRELPGWIDKNVPSSAAEHRPL
jgi:hypothetical protein